MGHLFLDIETYAAKGNETTALNPYHADSKILLIAYNYYDSFRPPVASDVKEPTFLKEWELGEKEMLRQFLDFLRSTQQKDKHLKMHGFNILKFDLPFLFGRMKTHNLTDEKELHEMLFRPFGHDMMQLSSIVSDQTRVKEQLWGIGQKDANKFFGIQVKEGTGVDCSRYYDIKDYDKIMKYQKDKGVFIGLGLSYKRKP